MKIDESNFIQELSNKNEKALDYVIDNYSYILKTVVSRHLFYLKDYQDECINDCLLLIWQNIDSFNPKKSSFKNWIAVIAKYKSIDYIRKYLKDTENKDIDKLYISDRKDNLDILLEIESKEAIINSLNILSPRDKEIFTDLYIRGLEIDEVAENMNLKKSNIYNIISRGRNKLRARFNKEVHSE